MSAPQDDSILDTSNAPAIVYAASARAGCAFRDHFKIATEAQRHRDEIKVESMFFDSPAPWLCG
jgi:hypothetical protein